MKILIVFLSLCIMNQKHSRHLILCIASLFLVLLSTFSCLFGQEQPVKEVGLNKPTISQIENQNIPGGDYKSFELKPGETCQTCIDACLNDPNCKAYTYVKPGAQRQNAVCWLKSTVSNPVADQKCISGVKDISGDKDLVLDASGSLLVTAALASELYGASSTNDGVTGQSMGENKSGVYGFNGNKLGYGVFGRNKGTGNTGYLGGPAAGVYGEGSLSGKAAIFKGNVQIRSYKTNDIVIELGEGLDYAEGFDITISNEVSPGTVLVIDSENPGKLTVSQKPYDHKVAGIVTGANGVNSGVRLGVDQFIFTVALAGRVYCNADATYGEVSPGDLLTTSPTPGHAMVVKDYTKAQGAVLGKAMQSLPKGQKGQILVLVTLQ